MTPNGMWTLGTDSEVRWSCWSSKKMWGRRVSRMGAFAMPPRKKAIMLPGVGLLRMSTGLRKSASACGVSSVAAGMRVGLRVLPRR